MLLTDRFNPGGDAATKGVIQVLHACFVQSRAILNLHIWDGSSALPNLELAPKPSLVFVYEGFRASLNLNPCENLDLPLFAG